jgi:hypothetical protein
MGLQLAAHLPLIQFDTVPAGRARILATVRTVEVPTE